MNMYTIMYTFPDAARVTVQERWQHLQSTCQHFTYGMTHNVQPLLSDGITMQTAQVHLQCYELVVCK